MLTRTLPLLPILALAGGIGLAHPHLRAAAEPPWKPVAPADLAATRPEVESDAPAEFLVHEILIDDRAFPAVSRARRYLQARWTYHQTIAELQVCSERTLRDMGVTHGIDEFARRAAGL